MELTVLELRDALAQGRTITLLDVREQWEFDLCHLPGSVLIPLSSLPERMGELDAATEVVTICHSGGRSLQAARFLKSSGHDKVRSLKGGVNLWAEQVDPGMARY